MPDTKELTQSQSLFQLEHELVELMALREEMAEAGEDLAACDQQIQEYVQKTIRKVDNVRSYLRHCEVMGHAAEVESHRLDQLAKLWGNRRDRLKDICRSVMEHFGIKRIEGQTGSLSLRGNGGFAPLTITDEALLPDEMCDYIGPVAGEDLVTIVKCLAPNDRNIVLAALRKLERHPNKGRIREALKRGPVAGVREDPRGVSLVVR